MATCNREAAKNIRAIDDVPQKSELVQYEKRLEELYQQVGALLYSKRAMKQSDFFAFPLFLQSDDLYFPQYFDTSFL